MILVYLNVRARSARHPLSNPARAKNAWQPRLLLLCSSTLLSLGALEVGSALWRARLNRSPDLTAAVPPSEEVTHPKLPNGLQGPTPSSPETARPLRILVIGESSGKGEPYHPWLSVAHIVAWRLEKVFPRRSIQVDMWAMGGAMLQLMHQKLEALTYRPDVLMVYVGHNEFQGRYAWMREVDYYLDEDRVPRGASRLSGMFSLLRFSPLCRLLDETRERNGSTRCRPTSSPASWSTARVARL